MSRLPAAARADAPPQSGYRRVLAHPRDPLPLVEYVDLAEAARILGCSVAAVSRIVVTGRGRHVDAEPERLPRPIVEDLATELYSWRLHRDDPESYWVTGQRAAEALGLSRARLNQLAARQRLPFVRHQDGTRLYRRHELDGLSLAPATS